MDRIIETLPLWSKILVYLVSGGAVAALVLLVPDQLLIRLGSHKRWTPNYLSTYRFPLTWAAYGVYFLGDNFLGFLMVVFAFCWDKLDGRQARLLAKIYEAVKAAYGNASQELKKYHPGVTPEGKWLDPLVDKGTLPWMLFIFGRLGFLDKRIVIAMLACELAGTIIRPPTPSLLIKLEKFLRKKELQRLTEGGKELPFNRSWIQRQVNRYVADSAATDVGKIKWGGQVVTMLACLPLHQRWCAYGQHTAWVTNGLLIVTTFFAAWSVVSRLRFRSEKAEKKLHA